MTHPQTTTVEVWNPKAVMVCVSMCCSVLQCGAVCCSILLCVAVWLVLRCAVSSICLWVREFCCESCRTYGCVMSHIIGTRTQFICATWRSTSHARINVQHENHVAHMSVWQDRESWGVMFHIWMSRVWMRRVAHYRTPRTNLSLIVTCLTIALTRMNESCHKYE